MTLKERCLTSLKGELPNSVPIAKYLFNQKNLQEELSYTSVLYGGNAQARLIVQLGIGGYGFLMNGFVVLVHFNSVEWEASMELKTIVNDLISQIK